MASALIVTEETALYMRAKFDEQESNPKTLAQHPAKWTFKYLHECNHAVYVIKKALEEKITTKWDVQEYVAVLSSHCTGRNVAVEERLLEQFPPPFTTPKYIRHPCIVTDMLGKVLIWYLPNILLPERQTQMWESLRQISRALTVQKGGGWRTGEMFYRGEDDWQKRGTVTMSPAWFQQGHEKKLPLEVSRSLFETNTIAWLTNEIETSALVGGILSIIHPDLYDAAMDAQREIFRHPDRVSKGDRLETISRQWSSPFGVISIISNRDTPFHRDNGGAHPWYDMLVPIGDYFGGEFKVPGIGANFEYDPGCVIGFVSRVLRHGALCPGDRAVIAYYMKEKVWEKLGISCLRWSVQ